MCPIYYVFVICREEEMDAKCVVQMDGKKTRLLKPKLTATIDNNPAVAAIRDNYNDFTFDHSYWSYEGATDGLNGNGHQHIVTQEEVYADLGTDVINCAFEGEHFIHSLIYIILLYLHFFLRSVWSEVFCFLWLFDYVSSTIAIVDRPCTTIS